MFIFFYIYKAVIFQEHVLFEVFFWSRVIAVSLVEQLYLKKERAGGQRGGIVKRII